MSERKAKLARAQARVQDQAQLQQKHRIRRLTIRAVSALVTLIGLAAAVVTFLPRITPSISDPTDALNPFSSSVTLVNSGALPLHDVTVRIAIRRICGSNVDCPEQTDHPDPNRYKSSASEFQHTSWTSHDLAIDDRFDVPLEDLFNRSPRETKPVMKFADIAVVVDYRIPLFPFKREKIFPLYTRKQQSGSLAWYWG